ncbi:MAG: LysR family transcriptional regulator [Ilumatobacteraceae bacterium]
MTQLRTFLAVVRFGSVRAAAEHLVVSQPAVSGAVASLERELGVELVEPDGRGLRVTPAGRAFAVTSKSGLDLLERGCASPRASRIRSAARCASPPSPPPPSRCCSHDWRRSGATIPTPSCP